MNKTYLSITITHYPKGVLAPDVHYYRNDGVHPAVSTFNKLSVAEANVMMWELVKLGGKNTYKANRFDTAICERRVTFWGTL